MTYSSLAAIVKYPYTSSTTPKHGKFGFFKSELDCFRMVATELGLIEKSADVFARHPLVYLMEAADDICYQVMDIEDAHKLKILGIEEVTTLLTGFFNPERCRHITGVLDNIDDDNEKVAYLGRVWWENWLANAQKCLSTTKNAS